MSFDLTGQLVSSTYGRVVQYVSGSLYDGFGNPVSISGSGNINTGSFATTGSNTFIGTQTITGSNGRLIYTGTTPGAYPALAEIHANNDYPWLERFYNDTFSTSSVVMAYFSQNDGRFVFHNESTQSIGLQVNGYNAENGLLVYSNKVAFVNNVEITGSLSQGLGIASGSYSHAEGDSTKAIGDYSHAEGQGTIAYEGGSHAEGRDTITSGSYSHAEGQNTIASGSYSHAEGSSTKAIGDWSHAEGDFAQAKGEYSHAEGNRTIASGSH